MFTRTALIGLVSVLLVACQTIRPGGNGVAPAEGREVVRKFLAVDAPLAPYGGGRAYEVNGTQYTPRQDYAYNKRGTASYYSSALNGAVTSSGEKYQSGLMTAAHKTLPFQTIVRVTNTRNGNVAIVRINDRGPFQGDRLIDVSEKAARDLGIIEDGIAQVRVEVLENETKLFAAALGNGRVIPGENPTETVAVTPTTGTQTGTSGEGNVIPVTQDTTVTPTETSGAGGYYVLVGTYTKAVDANAIRDRMAKLGNTTVEETSGVYKVYVGPLSSRLEAQAMLGRVFAEGATNASVVLR